LTGHPDIGAQLSERFTVASGTGPAQNNPCTCTSFCSGKRIVARLLVLRITSALLVGLTLCPLVPLLGRPEWPAWVGPLLGALFAVAMFRSKPAVKIAAALALGFGFNVFRELAHPRIVYLTRWSLPIGFFTGWSVYFALAALDARYRWIFALLGMLLIVGVAADRDRILAIIRGL
jgi:hypothetical protein